MLDLMDDYYWAMSAKHRLITADIGRGPEIFCTFFILRHESQTDTFHRRPIWSTPDDYPDGRILYIDKLIARVWNRILFREIERLLTEYHPSWEKAYWHQPALSGHNPDRLYTYHRRRSHGPNHHG